MKIVQITAIDLTIKAFLIPLIEALCKQGHQLYLITSDKNRLIQNLDIVKKYGIQVYDLDIPRTISLSRIFNAYRKMKSIFQKIKPDIVHTHTPVASLISRMSARHAHIKNIICTIHGFYFHERMPSWKFFLFSQLEKILAKYYTDYLFTVNQEDRKFAIEHHFLDKHRITYIHSVGIDAQNVFNPANYSAQQKNKIRANLGLTEGKKILTFVGRIVQEKAS